MKLLWEKRVEMIGFDGSSWLVVSGQPRQGGEDAAERVHQGTKRACHIDTATNSVWRLRMSSQPNSINTHWSADLLIVSSFKLRLVAPFMEPVVIWVAVEDEGRESGRTGTDDGKWVSVHRTTASARCLLELDWPQVSQWTEWGQVKEEMRAGQWKRYWARLNSHLHPITEVYARD